MVSIFSQDNLGGLELISGVYVKDGSLGAPGLNSCFNPKTR